MAQSLGAFQIDELLAHGGMGAVYIGFHLVEGYRAAIKVVPPGPTTHEALLHEVRATASLNHPGIVALYDYGEVTTTESRAADGELRAGSLWFAMEYATAGTLAEIAPPDTWVALRAILMEILDALAHAHARGLVHRDLKPANVLITQRSSGKLELLLADFGIAHVAAPDHLLPESTDNFVAAAAGTVPYMAPEQVQGIGRDQGPWTDLYALGCLAWELATGSSVFEGDSALAIAMAHVTLPPGPFAPRFDVPPSFEPWLRKLLRKPWRTRFQRAAHAARALDDTAPGARTHELDIVPQGRPAASDETLDAPATIQLVPGKLRELRAHDRQAKEEWRSRPTVALPATWRPTRPPRPVGGRTGLGLFGLREIPALGRTAERDALWRALSGVQSQGVASAMLLCGDEGSGKSKLLKWLGTRADELGVATVIRVGHGAMLGPTAGVPLALARHFACVGLSRKNVRARVQDALAHVESLTEFRAGLMATAVTEVLAPETDTDESGPRLRFGSPAERYAVIEELLRVEAASCPVLLLIDDVQWGTDTIGLVQHLMRRAEEQPFALCVVMTSRPDLLAQSPLAAKRLEALTAAGHLEYLVLGALDRVHHVALVREQVGLASALAEALVDRAGDDTNYSLCLIGDWVARDVLQRGPDGYDFVDHRGAEFPRDLTEAWGARLDRFCARFALPARVAESLEVAAVLGVEVDLDEWGAACAARDVETPQYVVERLVDAGIVRRNENGFGFTQSAVVTALVERARIHGRLATIHADCASAIRVGAPNGAPAAERRGFHLLETDVPRALAELEVAINTRLATSAYEEAVLIADRYLAASPPGPGDAALVVRAKRADALRYLGGADAARAEATAILAASHEQGSHRGRAEGLRVLAGLEHGFSDFARGIARYSDAITAYEHVGDSLGVAKCAHGRGWLYLNSARFGAARADFAMGAELAQSVDSPLDVAWSLQGLAEALTQLGELPAAEAAARDAIIDFDRAGSRSGHGMALATLANLLRDRGDFAAARLTYKTSIDLLGSFRSQLVGFPMLHLVVLKLLHGTTAALDQALDRVNRLPQPVAFRIVLRLVELARTTDVDAKLNEVSELLALPDASLLPVVSRVLGRLDEVLARPDFERLHAILEAFRARPA